MDNNGRQSPMDARSKQNLSKSLSAVNYTKNSKDKAESSISLFDKLEEITNLVDDNSNHSNKALTRMLLLS